MDVAITARVMLARKRLELAGGKKYEEQADDKKVIELADSGKWQTKEFTALMGKDDKEVLDGIIEKVNEALQSKGKGAK